MSGIVRPAVLGGAVLLLALTGSAAWGQPRELPARIVTLGGPAELYKKDTPTWTSAALRAEVGEGDSVRTQMGGRVTLKTGSGQALRLGSRSQVALPPGAGGPPTRVRFDYGWLWVAVMPAGESSQVEVRAGPAVITPREGGVGLRRNQDGSLLIQIHHGSAVCAGPERQWQQTLSAQQQLLVPASGAPGAPVKLVVDPVEATWVRWNADQDFAGGYGGQKPGP
ncbi:MAG TPA: FecR domain-containing protein [Methylomirabilota bacterium]|nr:FecR domain-containing protein [Methylomirabilota bacterium]